MIAALAAAATDTPGLPAPSITRDVAAAKVLVTRITSESSGRTYVIQSGDTLSGIAQRFCGNPLDWTGIWQENKSGIPDPDIVLPGQKVTFTCEDLSRLAGASDAGPDSVPAGNPGYQQPAVATAAVQAPPVSTAGAGSFEACVIARESGGNAQVMNSTGHYGLYQFSASTWAAYGGNPADFGNASAAEQRQVFLNAMATPGGAGNWSPYDGC